MKPRNMTNYRQIIRSVADVFFPRICPVCHSVLNSNERYVCIGCIDDIPVTHLHREPFNQVEQLLAGKVRIHRASSLFYYTKTCAYAAILHDIKYRNAPLFAKWITMKLSRELLDEGFFDGIDVIVPIPLHESKFAKRGYNQSEYIAKGISEITGIIAKTAIVADVPHSTQKHKHRHERWENTKDIFSVKNPDDIAGKHVLIVDDVITTGATITSAALEIERCGAAKISVLSLALAQL